MGFFATMIKCKCGKMVLCEVMKERDGDLIKHTDCELKLVEK